METIINPFTVLESRLKAIEQALDLLTSREISQSEKKFYTIAEAADKLNVAPITLYRNCQAGKIPSKKVGSRLMIPGSFVDGN